MSDLIPRHPWGEVDWRALFDYIRARWGNWPSSKLARGIRAESDEWRVRWRAAGCPAVGDPRCPPTLREIRRNGGRHVGR